MDGVLEGALVLCACKLACSLLFLPSLASSSSPVSFCSCCLLIFTDFLVTVFLSISWILDSWLSLPSPLADVVALRFLLFLSHTYGAVLLVTTPLTAAETLIRLLRSHSDAPRKTQCKGTDSDGQRCQDGEEAVEESDGDGGFSRAVGFFCCLTVWLIVALRVRWKWKVAEVWAAACLHETSSLVRCLPKLLGSMPSVQSPCFGWAFLLLALLFLFLCFLLFVTTSLQRQQTPAQPNKTVIDSHDTKNKGWWPTFAPDSAHRVDPAKTDSSCSVHRAWNNVQMSPCHHGDLIVISPACLFIKRGEGEHEGTMKALPLTFITEESMKWPHRSESRWHLWGFPCCLGLNVMTGLLGVLSIFVLPLYLSVNILLIRTIETLLELCMESFISPSPPTPPLSETLV